MKWRSFTIWFAIPAFAIGLASVAVFGAKATAPMQKKIGKSPSWLDTADVQYPSESGGVISGWYASPKEPSASVILLHGVRGNRTSMLGRARFLVKANMAVLLPDFQAHGESQGDKITFGHLESHDARAAVDFVKAQGNDAPIIVVGRSMGGAAALLAEPPLDVSGLVLEAVYPDISVAIENRLRIRLGDAGTVIAPILSSLAGPFQNIDVQALSPIEKTDNVQIPVLVISGQEDPRTTELDTLSLFESFNSEKYLWIVPGASHKDLHAFATEEYEQRILEFVRKLLVNAT